MENHHIHFIAKASDLITSREQTRAGFINFALEKNKRSTPYIESAKVFRLYASSAKNPSDLSQMQNIRIPLLTAAGLSDKALNHLTEDDKNHAIEELIKNFLEPAGEGFIDEVVYRYLLMKGDALGGTMRNLVGALAQQKLIRTLISNMDIVGQNYMWIDSNKPKNWLNRPDDNYGIENNLKAISWVSKGKNRVLAFNLSLPLIRKNVDICLFNCTPQEFNKGNIVKFPEKFVMFGELKGGIDPAGADEHWKTANSALSRIRAGYSKIIPNLKTSFIGAAIEASMASEIWNQLQKGELDNAANMTVENQLINYCNWILVI